MPLKDDRRVNIRGVPFSGGNITDAEPAELSFGAYSSVQNIRNRHPGMRKRRGTRALHDTTLGSSARTMAFRSFQKSRTSANHFFAQVDDGKVYEATNQPPTRTAGAFGSAVHTGTASGMIPGSFADLGDKLVYSNGSDQHQTYGGASNHVMKFVKFDGSAAPITIMPELGYDYTDEVTDGQSSTVAVLDSLDTYANNECLFLCTPLPAQAFTFTVSAANGNSSTASVMYWKNTGAFAECSGESDGTDTGGASLAKTGTLSWTAPTDEEPRNMFGASGYWYLIKFSAQLDAEVEISDVTYTSTFKPLQNVFDGVPVDAIEVYVEGTSQWEVYASGSIDLDDLASGKKIVILTTDPIEAVYWDVGSTPNDTGTTVTSFKYWNGTAFTDVGWSAEMDQTSGLANSGWMKIPRQSSVQPRQFEGNMFYAYAYEVIFDSQLANNTAVGIQVMPFYDINDFGPVGNCSCAWKNRAVYTFARYPEYLYVSQAGSLNVLNGIDYAILEAGDGRSNDVKAMTNFYNELLVFQEEKGAEGGCITLFQGHSPATFGKLILSTKLGTFSSNCVDVVDGVMTATASDEKLKKLCFFLSRYGVGVTDGRTVSLISDDIRNYFDPEESECIRRGYGDKHWLRYDPEDNVIRVGIVSGTSATDVNVFPVFDLVTKTWSFDVYGDVGIGCMSAISAGSGNNPTVVVGGGLSDGFVYHMNYTHSSTGAKGDGYDSSEENPTAIDAYAQVELNAGGEYLTLNTLYFRCKANTSGDITLSINADGLSIHSSITLDMSPEVTNQTIRKHRVPLDVNGQNITLKFRENGSEEDCHLIDWGVDAKIWDDR